ncbi:MAG: TVP38/TMEM64 family protein [Proteobacteria bacterium]|nr:TVP38/TMEM64 family protein [Pseudomonadota bacterium]
MHAETAAASPRWERPVALGLALAITLIAVTTLPVLDWLMLFIDWLRDAGPAGYALFALAYVVVAVTAAPASLLSLGAGLAWGPLVGAAVVLPSATLGATAAFLLGRTALRDVVQARVDAQPRFAAIDRAVADRGFLLVFLMRLSPLFPFNFLNYALGSTQVRLRDYVLATLIGMAPGALLYTWLGSTLTQVADLASGAPSAGAGGQALYWGGLAATLAVTVLVTRIARSALDAYVEPEEHG